MKSIGVKSGISGRMFDISNILLMVILSISIIYPFWHILVMSFSSGAYSDKMGLKLFPDVFTLQAYAFVIANKSVLIAYRNTVLRTIIGTTATTFFTLCGAYVLSKKDLPLRTFFTTILFITMYFSGGLIPSYLLIRSLNLYDKFLVYIIPGMLSAYTIFIARNFIMSLPDSLEESACIDGANELLILLKIILPLSLPIIATVALWSAVSHWNSWFDALVYTKSNNLIVLQLYTKRMMDAMTEGYSSQFFKQSALQTVFISKNNVNAATIIVTIGPIVIAYPFAQKYLIKGIMIGSIKG